MRIVIIDNHDSFVYNILHTLKEIGKYDVDIIKCDEIDLEKIETYQKIILSPGPGLPREAGKLLDLIKQYAPHKSILGICLGHQALAEVFGGTLAQLEDVYHGIQSEIEVDNTSSLFYGMERNQRVGRYHSWVVSNKHLPTCLKVTGISEDGQIMAFSHTEYDVHGVQFHPESILSKNGVTILKNFLIS